MKQKGLALIVWALRFINPCIRLPQMKLRKQVDTERAVDSRTQTWRGEGGVGGTGGEGRREMALR